MLSLLDRRTGLHWTWQYRPPYRPTTLHDLTDTISSTTSSVTSSPWRTETDEGSSVECAMPVINLQSCASLEVDVRSPDTTTTLSSSPDYNSLCRCHPAVRGAVVSDRGTIARVARAPTVGAPSRLES